MLSEESLIEARAAGKRLGKCLANEETPKAVTDRAISTFVEKENRNIREISRVN